MVIVKHEIIRNTFTRIMIYCNNKLKHINYKKHIKKSMTKLRIQLKLDKKFKCGILSLDLCKAFDTVNHKILLEKMFEIGVRGFANVWFKNYLDNRQQFVCFSKSESSMKKITCGVPQGSVLAPTLFLIYINSVNRLNLQGSVKLFADDTTVFYFGQTFNIIRKHMLEDLEIIYDWLKFNKLSLNFSKSCFMFISKDNLNYKPDPLLIDNNKIIYTKCIKLLVLFIDECLSWKIHTENVKNKILPHIGIISRLKYYISLHYLKIYIL